MIESKSRGRKAKVNINEVLRIGSVMERTNMQQRIRVCYIIVIIYDLRRDEFRTFHYQFLQI